MTGSAAFGLGVPQIGLRDVDRAAVIAEYVQRAERDGFDSLWVMETGLRSVSAPDELAAIPLLSYVSALTSTTRLGTSILLVGLRDPRWLAQEITTIDHLTQGRLIVGVGLGNWPRAELLGISRPDWPDRFEEALDVLVALWAPGTATLAGNHWQLDRIASEPKPLQQPHPPIWFGAHRSQALRRAARRGAGWMGAGLSSFDDFVRQRDELSAYLEVEGRDPAAFAFAKRVYVHVDEDEKRAARRTRQFFADFYGQADLATNCAVWGSAATCADQLAALRAEGASPVIVNPMTDYLEQLDAVSSAVIPLAS